MSDEREIAERERGQYELGFKRGQAAVLVRLEEAKSSREAAEAELERWKRPVEAFLLAKGEGHKRREAAAIDAMRAALHAREDSER